MTAPAALGQPSGPFTLYPPFVLTFTGFSSLPGRTRYSASSEGKLLTVLGREIHFKTRGKNLQVHSKGSQVPLHTRDLLNIFKASTAVQQGKGHMHPWQGFGAVWPHCPDFTQQVIQALASFRHWRMQDPWRESMGANTGASSPDFARQENQA